MFDFLTRSKSVLERELTELREQLAKCHRQIDQLQRELGDAKPLSESNAPRTWVPPGHFYSPLVDPGEPSVQRAMESEARPDAPLETFGIDETTLLEWFRRVAIHYAEHPFSEHASEDSRYFYGNPNFPLADALALLTFMAHFQPNRMIEVGSGYSSCAAIDVNKRYLQGRTKLTFIDPHPDLALQLIGPQSEYRDCFVRSKLQDVPTSLFVELQSRDILFIDSSHVAKTGSDVVDYMFRVLPSLRPGVIVHIHDIFYPFEYPRSWIEGENRSWNEAYLLRAFLHRNSSMRVLYMSDWFFKCRRPLVEEHMPLCVQHRGGSLWLEVV